jgi:molybdopterin molybdotransferase
VFLLPGAPAACFWAYELLAGRGVRRLAGRRPEPPYGATRARLARKIVSRIGLVEPVPVAAVGEDRVEPVGSFLEGGLAAGAGSDGFVLVPEESEGLPQAAEVTVHWFAAAGGA